MIINQANLGHLFTGYSAAFHRGLGQAEDQWTRLATRVASATREEKYGWLGKAPSMREWLGDRVIASIGAHDYAIRNKSWEQTIGVPREDIEDDAYGVFAPLFEEMGRSTAAHPNQLVFDLLAKGFETPCYDGQYFFDEDHPALDAAGEIVSVSNSGGGSGPAWFLIDDSRALKPIIYQVRKPYNFVRMEREEDVNVFMRKEYVYGVDGRSNVGFGFWQFAYGSRQPLNKDSYREAREALTGMKGDYGRPLGLKPRLLVVPSSLEFAALEILNAERDAAGATNVYKGTAELLVSSWL
ncbi:Mu-like prophage major head subunit gpT family protein [Neomegalonema sp.]|uniref:Mu-like prophage major head subunit gpT family protein n=1 Tax=Neomegalonema sp. TaxID=2039713 RepID=UPI002601693E|nr:Mu-like prophage major head subunit gpT family protein [Neomegalonema sp.]MDD2870120.1 Mu-like prophage major head subunit gpT family protein [Neomegalonema sp.]